MSTPTRPRVLPSASSSGTPRRAGAPPRTPAVAQTPRTSIKDQIRLLRQAARTPASSGGTPGGKERREAVRELVRKAADTGRLVIPSHIPSADDASAPPLTHLPIALYTLLLGIPPTELSRKPPRSSAPKTASSPFPGSHARAPEASLDDTLSALSLRSDAGAKDDVFGEEVEGEDVGGFIGGRDLEVLKVGGQALEELDLELGLFGGMRALDVRDNKLARLPSSLPHLGLLTTLNLSHNAFTEFPTLLALLPSLASLDLSSNALSTLSFALPTRTPMFPDSFASPPPAPPAPTTAFQALRTLVLEDNQIELGCLPTEGWPAQLDALHLAGNSLFPPRGAGPREVDLAASFVGAQELRYLGLERTGVASLSSAGRAARPALQVVNLSANAGLAVDGLDLGWGAHAGGASLCAQESGEAHAGRVELVVDAHLLPGANGAGKPRRHVFVPPSPEEARQPPPAPQARASAVDDDDPFWSSRARDSAQTAAASSRRDPVSPITSSSTQVDTPSRSTRAGGLAKPLAAFDDWDPPASTASSSRSSSRTPAPAAPSAAADASPVDASSVYATSYSAHSQTFALSATAKTPLASLPNGAFSLSTLAEMPFAPTLRAIQLSGRQIRSFVDVPPPANADADANGAGARPAFPALFELSITQSPIHLSPLAPSLATLFPGLRTLDVSESSVSDGLFAHAHVVRALLVDVGVSVVRARESGVRSLEGLEVVAREIKDGQVGNWRCEEIDVRDNLIDRLDPALGHLPLTTFLVDRNLFRRPNRTVWERDGSAGLLAWLRECP